MTLKIRLLVACLSLGYAICVSANTYLVLGSFDNREHARAEGERIVAVSGMAVMLQSSASEFRLLTPVAEDELTIEIQQSTLAAAGVNDSWPIDLADDLADLEPLLADLSLEEQLLGVEELARIDALLSSFDEAQPLGSVGNFLVVGSYAEEVNAETTVERLYVDGLEALVTPVIVDNRSLFRVLVGPYPESDEASLRARLVALDFDGAWQIQRQIAAAAEPLPVQRPLQLKPNRYRDIEYESDFNLARLKRRVSAD